MQGSSPSTYIVFIIDTLWISSATFHVLTLNWKISLFSTKWASIQPRMCPDEVAIQIWLASHTRDRNDLWRLSTISCAPSMCNKDRNRFLLMIWPRAVPGNCSCNTSPTSSSYRFATSGATNSATNSATNGAPNGAYSQIRSGKVWQVSPVWISNLTQNWEDLVDCSQNLVNS